jgi:thiamine biosynthesis lipoprotein
MDDVAHSASRFRGDSDLSRINDARGRLVPVRRLTIELVEVALAAARRTDGACDPTIGRSLVAAGYDADIAEVRIRPPRPAHRVESRADWTRVQVDHELGRVGVPGTVALDLGATAKAWTADRAAERLGRDIGVPTLVAIGGDVAASPDEHAWPVLVSEHEGGPGEVVGVERGGIATSSTTGRTWLTTDGLAHHVIDPRSGAPAAGGYRTATVLARTCVEANALSTAALVWGPAALDRVSAHPARLVDGAGQVVTTESWPDLGVAA